MARTPTTVEDIDAQIAKLREKKQKLMAKETERLGRIAADAGLSSVEISDEELKTAFAEIAARFRKPAAK